MFDEPTLVLDLDSHQLQAFTAAYADLESSLSGLNVLIETSFAGLTVEAYKTLVGLMGVTAYGLDLVRRSRTVDLVKSNFSKGKYLFDGIDGRNIWANDLSSSLNTLQWLENDQARKALDLGKSLGVQIEGDESEAVRDIALLEWNQTE
ncbi:hypothetical protein V6N13_103280 [Hibiscus sabdariffa]